MNAITILDRLFGLIDEVIFPALAAYVLWQIRQWMNGKLQVPPHIHEVSLKQDDKP